MSEHQRDACPKCGAEVFCGYGLAGGGIGVYTYCDNEACDYFDKTQDPGMEKPAPASPSEHGAPKEEGK